MIVNESKFNSNECVINSLTLFKKKLPMFIVLLVLSIIILASGIIIYFITKEDMYFILIFIGVLFVLLSLLFIFYYPKKIRSTALFHFKNGVSYKYEFNDDKIVFLCKMDNTVTKNEISYKSVRASKINDNLIFIFNEKNQFYPLKLSGFKNDNDKELILKRIIKEKK